MLSISWQDFSVLWLLYFAPSLAVCHGWWAPTTVFKLIRGRDGDDIVSGCRHQLETHSSIWYRPAPCRSQWKRQDFGWGTIYQCQNSGEYLTSVSNFFHSHSFMMHEKILTTTEFGHYILCPVISTVALHNEANVGMLCSFTSAKALSSFHRVHVVGDIVSRSFFPSSMSMRR